MTTSSYLRPKASFNGGKMKRKNGMFMNPPPYPGLGGFTAAGDLEKQDPPMTLEKSPQSRTGKPI